ncbi:MAG: ComF family protein [Rhodomicrobium sp.]|nr:ComF family protein [Rhodomicrobium sp.]
MLARKAQAGIRAMTVIDDAEELTGAARMKADLKRWTLGNLRYAADLILPPICIHCHAPVASHGMLCAGCWGGIRFITPPVCGRLGLPLPYAGEAPALSSMALRNPPIYGRARAAARFEGVMRNLIHGFKYADRHEGAGFFSDLMRAAGEELLRDADMMMPIPLHPRRLWTRRYNQAAILTHRLGAMTGIPVDLFSLRRIRRTPSQVGLSSAERARNVAAAFALSAGSRAKIRGKRILLIDDVITTGSTLSACARLLKEAGAAEVDCLAAAIAAGDNGRTE